MTGTAKTIAKDKEKFCSKQDFSGIKKESKIRQCISCRIQLVRDKFIRLTKTFEKVVINPNRHQLGRSAYLCKSPTCINTAIKEKKIAKMLRISIKSMENAIPELEKFIPLAPLRKGVAV